uniref:Nuclear receptor domain-containing protein n=1 Tax=Meloidogyne enterolobii TaxID=390850 RepID=A0A6V7WC11_MELEN|nr:unnamed protein product [Meloidogyne enterolobii]
MQRNFIKQCKVCGTKQNVCFHYGVCTCRACGAFFRHFLIKFYLIWKNLFKRRYLENKKECKYKCKCLRKQLLEENKDGKSETNLAKCRKCRLDKCLSVGMKRLDVVYLRQDINREAMKEEKNEINLPNPPIVDISIMDQQKIKSILPIIEAQKRIMHAFNDLDDIFLYGPILFEEIILSNFNIFRLTDNFSPNPGPIPFEELDSWKSSFRNKGMLNKRWHKYFLVDRLLCFGVAKSMPVFEKLTLSDQIAQLRQIRHLFTSFTNTYLAWELGSETWTRKDNVTPVLGIMNNSEYSHDEK